MHIMLDEIRQNSAELTTPSTPTQRYVAQKMMDDRGFNPINKLMDLVDEIEERIQQVPDNPYIKERIQILTKLATLYAPAPKAIDINYTSDQKYTIQAVDFTALAQERAQFVPLPGNYTGPALSLAKEEKE